MFVFYAGSIPYDKADQSRKTILTVVIVIIFVALLIGAILAYYCRRRKLRAEGKKNE